MVDVNPVNKNTTVSVNSSGSVSQIKTTTPQNYYDGLAKQWAIDEGLVQGIDYSSKHYAQESEKSAKNAKTYAEQVGTVKNEAISEINLTKNETTEIIQNISSTTIQNINEIKDNAVTDIDTTKEETLSQIEKEAQEQLKNIQSTGFYMRDDKLYFINSEGEEEEFKSGGAGAVMFDTKIADHILQGEEALGWALQGTYVYKNAVAGEWFGYPDFIAKCIEEKEAATATEVTLGGSTLTMYVNDNGHQFYDIADKSIVDAFYETYGIADFYGIDEENQRVFLPRDKYFAVTGKAMGNGLLYFDAYNNGDVVAEARKLDKVPSNSNNALAINGDVIANTASFGIATDPEKSGIVLQPNENRYLYYCVGNTEVSSAITNVTEITESENDSNPLGSSFYFNNIQPNAGWLKSSGQWNDGNIYTTFYNWLVEEYTNNASRTDIKDVSEEYTDFDYVLNQDEMTFRLPLLNGSEDIVSDRYDELELLASGATYTSPANGYFYLDKVAGSDWYYVSIKNEKSGVDLFVDGYKTSPLTCIIPAKKSENVFVHYNATGKTNAFRFIYAQGNGSLYFKVANAVQNLELLDAGEVLEGLATKLDRGNKEEIVSWAMPDYSAGVEVTFPKNKSSAFTAPCDGYYISCFVWSGASVKCQLYINGVASGYYYENSSGYVADRDGHTVPLAKGDTIYWSGGSGNFTLRTSIFYPCKGVN